MPPVMSSSASKATTATAVGSLGVEPPATVPTPLEVFRLLIENEPEGLAAGEVARRMAVPHNTMSTHLAILTRAGLITAERQSRSIVYRARLDAVRELAGYLVQDCCGGRPE